MRLDNYLTTKGIFESRNRAKEAILEERVSVNKRVVKKPSFKVKDSDLVEIKSSKFYISRGAKKLEEYLKESPVKIDGLRCLDVGSSTGGFTQILLENGAKEVVALDVGREQLHPKLYLDSRVIPSEGIDIRDFKADPFDIIVSDISFISLNLVLNSINRLAKDGATIILLFKPQFEVGREAKRDSRGVVVDNIAIQNAKERFLKNIEQIGWRVVDSRYSRVEGKAGNKEIFFRFEKPKDKDIDG
jgi:23S rRNA (cytidine1920-2'-O)/16S rRNA (cytidine1409-2'-O)-methyltransferase